MDSPRVVTAADDQHWTSICYGNGSRIVATLASVKAREKALDDKSSPASLSSTTKKSKQNRFPLLKMDFAGSKKPVKLRYRVRPDNEVITHPPVRDEGVNVNADEEASGKKQNGFDSQSNDFCISFNNTTVLQNHQAIMKGNEQNERPPRSRAIAIKRTSSRLGSSDNNEEPTCLTEEYDWATWRMFNRITDHRRRYPIRYIQHPTASSVPSSSSGGRGRQESGAKDGSPCDGVHHPQQEEDDYFFDGEVFDLEL